MGSTDRLSFSKGREEEDYRTECLEDTKTERHVHLLRQFLHYIVGEEFQRLTEASMKKHCNGCLNDRPSQTQHDCLYLDEEDPLWDVVYEEASLELDLNYVHAIWLEVANIQNLDVSLVDFTESTTVSVAKWKDKGYRNGRRAFTNDDFSKNRSLLVTRWVHLHES